MARRTPVAVEAQASCRCSWRGCTALLAGLLVAAACVTPVDPSGQSASNPEGGAAGLEADPQSGGSTVALGGAQAGGTGGGVDGDSGGVPEGEAGREPGAAGTPMSAGSAGVTPAGGSGALVLGGSAGGGFTGGSGNPAGFAGAVGEPDAAGAAGAGGSGNSGAADGAGGSGGDGGASDGSAGSSDGAAGTDASGGGTDGSGGSSGADGSAGSGGTDGAGGSSGSSGCVTDPGIEVRYQASGTSSEIQAEIRVFNASAPSTTITDLAVRYYLTQSGEGTLRPVVNHAGTQTAGGYYGATASAAVHAYTPAVADVADTYIEFIVDSSTALSPGDYVRFQWQAGSGFIQTNDFSFDADADFSSAHNRITIHEGAEQIYGCLPE